MKQLFSIPKPCSENWDTMTPTDKGAFCQKCAHDVHDLSQLSQEEIRTKLKNNQGGSLCIRIRHSQLDALNDEVLLWYKPDESFKHRLFLFALFMVFGMTVFNGSAQINNLVNELQTTHQQLEEVGTSSANSIIETLDKKRPYEDKITKGMMMTSDGGGSVERHPVIAKSPTKKTKVKPALLDSSATIPTDVNTNLKFNITAYPNPTRTSTTLKIDVPTKTKFAIKVFSISGNQVQSYGTVEFASGSNEFEIDLESFARGTYIIGLQSEEFGKAVHVKKL